MFISKIHLKEIKHHIKSFLRKTSADKITISRCSAALLYGVKGMAKTEIGKRFRIESNILDFSVCLSYHKNKIDIITWIPSECPNFKYEEKFPDCSKKHTVHLNA